MNNEKTISIKEEQLDVMCADPNTMFLDDPLGVFWSTDCIKKDVRLNFGWDEKENNNPAVSTLLQAILEAEREFCPPPILVPKKERFAENTLGLSWITDFIKEEPELDLEADETENIVVFSTRTAFNGTRLIQKSGEICGISFEENVNKGGIQNNPESTQYTMFSTDISGLKEEEEEEEEGGGGGSLFETTLNCSLKEREFHKFICSFCLQIFHSKYRLIKHVFIHISGVQSPMYVCKSCGEVFSSNITMNKHLRKSDNYDVGGGNRGCDDASENRICLEEDRKVPIYEKIEDQSSSIETRKNCKNERTGMTPIAEKPIGTDSKGRKKIYKCDVCERSFSRPDHLSNHALTHSEARPHKCGKCGKSYNVFYSFKKHMFRHTGKRPHRCDVCGKHFIDLSTLNRHTFFHSGQKPYKCDICGKCFPQLSSLKAHAFTHTGNKPHKCRICGRSFNFLGNVKRHEVRHTGVRPHKCNVCGKYFTEASSLKEHAVIHCENRQRSHKCDICGKSFFTARNLKSHGITHTGLRPHKCNICGRAFTLFAHLKRHSLIHAERRPSK